MSNDLKVERIARQLTPEQTAQLCGVSRSYYVRIESGERSPSSAVRFRIARALGVHPLTFESRNGDNN